MLISIMSRPQTLELTASDELVAIENLDVLKRNGFELEVREDPDSDVEMVDDESSGSQMRGRLSLVAQPVSKSTMFDMKGSWSSFPTNGWFLNFLIPRPGRTYSLVARSPNGADGSVFKGQSDVCL
jgi:hypothetical protein